MQVFVDSNQFIADFAMEGAPFGFLAHILNTSGDTLLVSRTVIEEVDNKYIAEAAKAISDAKKTRQRLQQLGLPTGDDALDGFVVPPFGLEARIKALFEQVEVVEYADVPHVDIVQRALKRRKPFDAEGHVGYRDALLWLSLVRRLKSGLEQPDEELVFISSNWKDFYQGAPAKDVAADERERAGGGASKKPRQRLSVQFHSDIAEDLSTVTRPVLPFYTVSDFVETRTHKRTHIINTDKKFELFEEFLEESGLTVLRQMEQDKKNADVVLETVFPRSVAGALTVLGSDAHVGEGVEDLDINLAEPIGKDVYVDCNFDLRIVNVDVFVPRNQFEAHRAEIESASHVWDVSDLGDTVCIRLTMRAYFQASFKFEPRTLECSGLYLHSFAIR